MIRVVESSFITSATKIEGFPETSCLDFAFVGRSNVGKSSMINTLTNRKLLAKTANTPGKTRLINFFDCRFMTIPQDNQDYFRRDGINAVPTDQTGAVSTTIISSSMPTHFTLVDLPGYGFARVSKAEKDSWKRMINDYLSSRRQLAGVVLLVDSRQAPDPKDIIMINLLRTLDKNFLVTATKCDKISSGQIPSALKKIQTSMQIDSSQLCSFSSVKKRGVEQILNWFETIMGSVVV